MFGVTYSDVQSKIVDNPTVTTEFSIGPSGTMSDTACETIIAQQEQRFLSMLPQRYRELSSHIDGEILTEYSTGTTFTASLIPVSGTLTVYQDYPLFSTGWENRNSTYAATNYTADYETGQITLSSLPEGSRVYAEYDIAPTSFVWFADMVATLVAIEVSRRFAYFREAEGFTRFGDWEMNIIKDMERLRKGEMGFAPLDNIKLVKNETGKKESYYDFFRYM